jgi:8-oxo-dGTP pyrophosphatase MutT (NUDIX family)
VWDFPGGHVNPGEHGDDALRRELAEELGIELEGLENGPVLQRVDAEAGLDLTVWVSRQWRGDVVNRQLDEHDAIGWFERDQLGGLNFADPSYLALLHRVLTD